MLRKFKVKYFAGFDNEIVLDLSNPKNYEFKPQCVSPDGTIRTAVIHGINGVGKSNLGLAIFDIFKNLTDFQFFSDLYPPYLCANRPDDIEAAEFEYIFRFENQTVVYSYAKRSLNEFVRERLTIDDETVIDFDRSEGNTRFITLLPGSETLNNSLDISSMSVLKYVYRNTQRPETSQNRAFNAMFEFVEHMLFYKHLDIKAYISEPPTSNNLMLEIIEAGALKKFETFLRNSGIKANLRVVGRGDQRQIVNVYKRETLPLLEVISTGTAALMLFFCWYLRIVRGGVTLLFIDEFDAFYHFKLSRNIITLLRDTPGIQFILTSHNPATITNSLLRPDCYFLMDRSGVSSLPSRTPKDLREAHNIEKMYKAAAFSSDLD